MENKTTLTYCFSTGDGDDNFFLTLSSHLAEQLSEHTVEWKHTYGRSNHMFKLKAKILPLTSVLLSRTDLITKPYFHIFWTDCYDLSQYKSTVREEISSWINQISVLNNVEWMIVVIVNDVLSRITKAKLPLKKTTIADRVKADFCPKNPDRLQLLHEPNKDSTKATESWISLVAKVADATVKSMEAEVSKYEDHVRSERERRNEKSWDFCTYLLLQEELAFMYELLGMFGSALVQYDELDAMYTQYIVNAKVGDVAHWLGQFSQPISEWHSLLTWKPIDDNTRCKIREGRASLIDVRNYLFSRLIHLMFKMGKVNEICHRMHYFLQSITAEAEILEISIPSGAIQCWAFMCSLELVDALTKHSDLPNGREKHDSDYHATPNDGAVLTGAILDRRKLMLESAILWDLARLKLFYLGNLCGLLPCTNTKSEHLHVVVDLLAGMGDDEERGDDNSTPHTMLREALSSKSKFQRHYFELSELAMGTFKHMGRYRAARRIGMDLADFYIMMEEPFKAEGYLVDWARMFAVDRWPTLYSYANQKLAECYKKTCNLRKYLSLCYELTCDKRLRREKQIHYCKELYLTARALADNDKVDDEITLSLSPFATLTSVRFIPARVVFPRKSQQQIELKIRSHAPIPVHFSCLVIGMEGVTACSDCASERQLARKKSNASSLFKVAIDSDEEEKLSPCTSPTPSSSSNKESLLSVQRRIRGRSISSSARERAMQPTELLDDGVVELINSSQENRRHAAYPWIISSLHGQKLWKDGDLVLSGVTCRHTQALLRRMGSSKSQFEKYDRTPFELYNEQLEKENVEIVPGDNQILIDVKTEVEGSYCLQQLILSMSDRVYLVQSCLHPLITYKVSDDRPTLHILPINHRLYAGIPEYITVTICIGDREITDCVDSDSRLLVIKSPSCLRILKAVQSVTSNPDGMAVEDGDTKLTVAYDQQLAMFRFPLPVVSCGSTITVRMLCICDVAPVIVAQADSRGSHRRTQSAPPTTLSLSPQFIRRTQHTATTTKDPQIEDHPLLITNCGVDQTAAASHHPQNSSVENQSCGPSSGSDSDTSMTSSLRYESEMTEVKLSDDDMTAAELMERPTLKVPQIRLENPDGHGDVIKSCADEVFRSKDTSIDRALSVGVANLTSPLGRRLSHTASCSTSRTPRRVDAEQTKEETICKSAATACEITVISPWSDVELATSSPVFISPLNFFHAWHVVTTGARLLVVTVENVTTRYLRLSDASLRLVNPDVHATVQPISKLGSSSTLRSAHTSSLAWEVHGVPDSSCHLNLVFTISVTSMTPSADSTRSSTYKFGVRNVEPIYSVTCAKAREDEVFQCGVMTSLRIVVRRIRTDPGHETTSAGQQLLMFQAVDSRGHWAICGKSTGILTFASPTARQRTSNPSDEPPIDSTTINVMPLVAGKLHLPFVILHRYMKRRSSEFDELLGSTNSPVLKPPKLKAFERGEVLYCDQARQLRVISASNQHEVT